MGSRRFSESEWRGLFEEYYASGMSRKAFLEERGLSRSSFENWHRRLQPNAEGKQLLKFMEVPVVDKRGPAFRERNGEACRADGNVWAIEIALSCGAVVRMRG